MYSYVMRAGERPSGCLYVPYIKARHGYGLIFAQRGRARSRPAPRSPDSAGAGSHTSTCRRWTPVSPVAASRFRGGRSFADGPGGNGGEATAPPSPLSKNASPNQRSHLESIECSGLVAIPNLRSPLECVKRAKAEPENFHLAPARHIEFCIKMLRGIF